MTKYLTFPGLGLEFHLNPIAFSVFGWPIHWYGIIIACGFLLAVWYGVGRGRGFGVDEEKLTDLLFFAVPMALVGARAYYVIFYPSLYVRTDGSFDWGRAVAIWDGGLAIYGGLIAAVATAAVYCKVRRQNLWDYTDCGAYGFLIGQLVGRWGNFVNVEAFGSVTDAPWRMAGPDIANYLSRTGQVDAATYQQIVDGTLGVHPTFLYESLWNLLGFILLVLFARKVGRKFSGQIFLLYVVWYGLGRAFIEGLRTDSLYFLGTGIRISQIVGLVSAAAAIGLMIFRLKTAGPPTPPLGPDPAQAAECGGDAPSGADSGDHTDDTDDTNSTGRKDDTEE